MFIKYELLVSFGTKMKRCSMRGMINKASRCINKRYFIPSRWSKTNIYMLYKTSHPQIHSSRNLEIEFHTKLIFVVNEFFPALSLLFIFFCAKHQMHWTEHHLPKFTRNLHINKLRSPMEFFLRKKSVNCLVVRIKMFHFLD